MSEADTEVEEHTEETQSQDTSTEEERREAASLGWVPPEKWHGAPPRNGFMTAAKYIENAQQNLPVMRTLLSKEREARKADEAKWQARQVDFERRLDAQAKQNQRALDLQKQSLVEKYEEEKRQALAIEDPQERRAAYDGATRRERDAFSRIISEERQPEVPRQEAPQISPEIQSWGARNPWVNYVPDTIKQEAVALMAQIEAEEAASGSSDMSVTQKLDKVTDIIRDRHQQWFPPREAGNQSRASGRQASAVEGGSSLTRNVGGASRVKGFKDLPSEAKAAFNDLLERGALRPMRGEAEDKAKVRLQSEYAKNYWDDYGE